ncbi:Uncharacterised protein [uncultured archaeon]|nr:Uncharacterised protein [uncultured archaeon]
MNEEERRHEILRAEAAIRELAMRMAETSECTRQADTARSILESAVRSIDDLKAEIGASIESEKRTREEESESLRRTQESLASSVQEFRKSQERFEKKADHLETTIGERSQELLESVDARLVSLSRNIETISNKLTFIMDQNEASSKRTFALQKIVEELSGKFQEFGDCTISNSEEIQELESQITSSNERLSSLEQAYAMKTAGLSHRLRSAIIGGGLGMVMILMIIKLS